MSEDTENKLGQYQTGEGEVQLSQDQILGIGGGSVFYEIIHHNGTAKKHVAMPVLLRDRGRIKDLLKAHAQCLQDMDTAVRELGDDDEKNTELRARLEDLDERDYAIMLKVAFHCFKRLDPALFDIKDEDAGAAKCGDWMDVKQLRQMPEIAMGLNRFNPLKGAGLM